jgi:hypothetical protein
MGTVEKYSLSKEVNEKVWNRYQSKYSFPKKQPPKKLGKVFDSTVQNYEQHYLGKVSPGAMRL